MKITKHTFRAALVASTSLIAVPAFAQAADQVASAENSDRDVIIVTATRRDETVQSVPINIAAVTADTLDSERAFELREVARLVPGVYLVDQGTRNNPTIVFRGLNADPLGSNDGGGFGGTVSSYYGEIPLNVSLRVPDIERVEFLLGPQGTLYGAGTLGGAIRYIPTPPQLGEIEAEAWADLYTTAHGDGISSEAGVTINLPIGDRIAFRGTAAYLNDEGFIDYPYAVNIVGVSDPDEFTDPSNFRPLEDVNDEQTLSVRAALRVQPADWIDVTFAYVLQDQETGGRQISNRGITTFPVAIGDFQSALRVPEPNDRRTQLFSVEAVLDLGFAELTSATGWSTEREIGNRDQTDLLISLEYSYELFPSFTAYTLEDSDTRVFTQELRLVSQHGGPVQWIVGGFYNNYRNDGFSKEFTPGYAEYLGGFRPDALEYFNPTTTDLEERAIYGEIGYDITDRWNITVGGRYYDYDLVTSSAVDLPLFETVFNGRDPYSIVLDFETGGQSADGFLWKINTSYDITDDVMIYGTVSEGYRIGNSNALPLCPNPLPANQIICALPDEFQYGPDQTLNFEIGFKSQWFDRRLTVNAAVYYIDWSDPQVSSASVNGLQPITINGAGAETKGFELAVAWRPTDELSFRGSYAYTDPQLTDVTANLIRFFNPPGFGPTLYADGQSGDRLPGSPHHQAAFFASYERPISDDLELGLSYSFNVQSNVLRTVGGRGNAYTLSGFSIHNAAISLESDHWTAQLYVNNIFDKYAEVGVRGNTDYNQVLIDDNGGNVYQRTFGAFVLPPRQIGIRITTRY